MSQHLTAIRVANGIDVGLSGLEVFIDGNACAFGVVETCPAEVSNTRGARPTAISTSSASTVTTFPFLSVKTTPSSVMAVTRLCRWNVTPCFSNDLRSRLAMSESSMGRHSFRNSTTVTCVPKALKMLANSMPMTPAPMMQRLLGRWSSDSRSEESSTRRRTGCSNRNVLGTEPLPLWIDK